MYVENLICGILSGSALFAKTKSIFRVRITIFPILESTTYDPLLYTIDHSDFIVYSFMDNSIGLEMVKSLYS